MIQERFEKLLNAINIEHEMMMPSYWAEKRIKLTSEISTIKGPFKYKYTPYAREIVDHFSPYSPAKVVAVMKGSQSGLTQGAVIPGICWMIENQPGNLLFTSAGDDLSKEMIETRLDSAIRSAKIDHLIRPNVIKKKNQRTGDTATYKEYAGGRAFFGGTGSTDKLSRQRSLMYGIFDDWDAAKKADKVQGDLFTLLQKRFSTAKNVMKQFYISTPETRPSNIESVYLLGDQRKWMVPCPLCGTYIELVWSGKKEDGTKYGVDFEKTNKGILIQDSVGYVCQECLGRFKEKEKYEMNLYGKWVPTAEPQREGYYSYHLSNLVSAPFMMGWRDFAEEYIEIYKKGESKSKLKVFMNQTLGVPWEERQEKVKQNQLARNTRNYKIGTVPNQKSKEDGNGPIMILTCAGDLHGHEDDGRLDYEVVGHSANGAWYSITHGSIGTFQAGKKDKGKREKVSFRNGLQDGGWDRFYEEVVNADYPTDDGGSMRIISTGLDTGHLARKVYRFINEYPAQVIGVKGKDYQGKYKKTSADTRIFKQSVEMPFLYILEVEQLKDQLVEMVALKKTKPQTPGFMNFPIPSDGKYTVSGYFQQYEAEERSIETNEDGDQIGWKWINPKNRANHYFDCAVYNLALREIFAFRFCKRMKIKEGGWDYVTSIMEAYA